MVHFHTLLSAGPLLTLILRLLCFPACAFTHHDVATSHSLLLAHTCCAACLMDSMDEGASAVHLTDTQPVGSAHNRQQQAAEPSTPTTQSTTGRCQLLFKLVAQHNNTPQQQRQQQQPLPACSAAAAVAAVAGAAAGASRTAAELWQQLAALQLPEGVRVLQVQVEEQQQPHLAASSPAAQEAASHTHCSVALVPATISLPNSGGDEAPATLTTELCISNSTVRQLLQHSAGYFRVVVAAQPSGTLLLDSAHHQQQQAAAPGTAARTGSADEDGDVLLQLELDTATVAAAAQSIAMAAGAALVCTVAVLPAIDGAGSESPRADCQGEAAAAAVAMAAAQSGRTAAAADVMLLPLLLLPGSAHEEVQQLLTAAGQQYGMSSKQAYAWLLPLLQDFALLLQWKQQRLQLQVQEALCTSVSGFFAANGMVECRKLLGWHGQQQQQQ